MTIDEKFKDCKDKVEFRNTGFYHIKIEPLPEDCASCQYRYNPVEGVELCRYFKRPNYGACAK